MSQKDGSRSLLKKTVDESRLNISPAVSDILNDTLPDEKIVNRATAKVFYDTTEATSLARDNNAFAAMIQGRTAFPVRLAFGQNTFLAGTITELGSIVLADSDEVLFFGQTGPTENGVYTYDSGTQRFVRSTEFADLSALMRSLTGLKIQVSEGFYADFLFVCGSAAERPIIGTDSLFFSLFAPRLTAGDGLQQIGDDFSAKIHTSAQNLLKTKNGDLIVELDPDTHPALQLTPDKKVRLEGALIGGGGGMAHYVSSITANDLDVTVGTTPLVTFTITGQYFWRNCTVSIDPVYFENITITNHARTETISTLTVTARVKSGVVVGTHSVWLSVLNGTSAQVIDPNPPVSSTGLFQLVISPVPAIAISSVNIGSLFMIGTQQITINYQTHDYTTAGAGAITISGATLNGISTNANGLLVCSITPLGLGVPVVLETLTNGPYAAINTPYSLGKPYVKTSYINLAGTPMPTQVDGRFSYEGHVANSDSRAESELSLSGEGVLRIVNPSGGWRYEAGGLFWGITDFSIGLTNAARATNFSHVTQSEGSWRVNDWRYGVRFKALSPDADVNFANWTHFPAESWDIQFFDANGFVSPVVNTGLNPVVELRVTAAGCGFYLNNTLIGTSVLPPLALMHAATAFKGYYNTGTYTYAFNSLLSGEWIS